MEQAEDLAAPKMLDSQYERNFDQQFVMNKFNFDNFNQALEQDETTSAQYRRETQNIIDKYTGGKLSEYHSESTQSINNIQIDKDLHSQSGNTRDSPNFAQ